MPAKFPRAGSSLVQTSRPQIAIIGRLLSAGRRKSLRFQRRERISSSYPVHSCRPRALFLCACVCLCACVFTATTASPLYRGAERSRRRETQPSIEGASWALPGIDSIDDRALQAILELTTTCLGAGAFHPEKTGTKKALLFRSTFNDPKPSTSLAILAGKPSL